MTSLSRNARIAGLLYLTLLTAPLRLIYIPSKLPRRNRDLKQRTRRVLRAPALRPRRASIQRCRTGREAQRRLATISALVEPAAVLARGPQPVEVALAAVRPAR